MAEYSEVIPTSPGHYVYRLWAADGTCLYVGLTGEVRVNYISSRFRSHRRNKSWWSQVARIDVATFESPAEIIEEERLQVSQLEPVHNKRLLAKCQRGHDRTPENLTITGMCRVCHAIYKKTPEIRIRDRNYKRRRRSTLAGQLAEARYQQRSRIRRWGPPPGQATLW